MEITISLKKRKKPIKEFKELHDAYKNLIVEVYKSTNIIKIIKWLSNLFPDLKARAKETEVTYSRRKLAEEIEKKIIKELQKIDSWRNYSIADKIEKIIKEKIYEN